LPRKIEVPDSKLHMLYADVPNMDMIEVDSPLEPYMNAQSYRTFIEEGGVPSPYGHGLLEEVHRYGLLARAIAKREKFDIIHAHDWLSYRAGVEAKKISGKPLILHVHATGLEQAGGTYADERVVAVEKSALEAADAVVAVSGLTRGYVTGQYGINPEKVHVVHNGSTLFDENSDEIAVGADEVLRLKELGNKIVLSVGRLTLHKGPDYLLRAAARVLQYAPDTYFVFAGDGEMQHQLLEMAAAMGIGERVLFTGFLRGAQLRSLFRAADLFVLPSVAEPFGLVAIESLAFGTPVLVSKQSGVGEALTHSLKVDFWDTDEMVNKIVSVLNHPPLQSTLTYNGRQEAEHLTWSRAADKCIALYNSLLNPLHQKTG
jgi:glycogen synthase